MIQLITLYVNQLCINNLFPKYCNKMTYIVLFLTYMSMMSVFVGLDYFLEEVGTSLRILSFFLLTLLFATYLQ